MNDWNADLSAAAKTITVDELKVKCESVSILRAAYDEAKDKLKEIENQLSVTERELIEMLDSLNMKSFKTDKYNYIKSVRRLWRVPREGDRKLFFDYLKEKGIFDSMITINSQTLNSYAKNVFETAEREGTLLETSIPGLGEPEATPILQVRKA